MKKRFISIILTLAMLTGLFVMPVSAETVLNAAQDPQMKYSDSADEFKGLLTDGAALEYTYGTGEDQVGLGTKIGASNWRLRNAAESPDGIGYAEETNPITFGINTSGYLMVKARPAVAKDANNEVYDTSTAARIPAIVLDTDELENLSSSHKVKAEVNRIGHPVSAGIRFMVHNNGKNYYALIINGSQLTNRNAVELVKSVDGNVTTVAEFGTTTKLVSDSFVWTEITVNNGVISIIAGDVKGSYIDREPFNVSGKDAGVWLMATNAGNSADRYAYFRNIEINNLFIDTVPEDMIFADAAEGKTADGDGVIDFGKAVPIRKLLYTGEVADRNILVSNDKEVWYILSNVSQFADGAWTNQVTAAPYRYVKADGITNNIKFLTEAAEIATTLTGDPITLYPRVKGTDVFGTAAITADTAGVVDISGTVITPAAKGTTNITATATVNDNEYTITIPVTVNGENEFSYVDDISGAAAQSLTGLGNQIAGTSWRMRNDAETPDGLRKHKQGEDGEEDAEYGINSYGMFVEAVYDTVQRYNTESAAVIPSLVLTKDLTGLSANHKITFDTYKNHFCVTPGVRFMVHNGGKNYYALIFGGGYYEQYAWELVKSVDGTVTSLVRGTTTDYPGYATMRDGSGTFWNVSIAVTDNEISFAVKDANDANAFGYSYTDNEMFDVSGNNAGVWLMSMNGNNVERYAAFKNFKIENYLPYISGYEPSKAVYLDAAEGKTAGADGVIDLGAEYTVRKILASGTGNAYISKDKERWFSLGALENGAVLNSVTEQGMRYVKTDSGLTDVKVLAEISQPRLELSVGDELTLYPYINGEMTDITLSSSSENLAVDGFKITAVGKENGVLLTASNADSDSITVVVDIKSELGAEFTYVVDENDETKWNFTVDAPCAKNGTYAVIIAYYRADGSLSNAQLFENVAFDSEGIATLTANAVTLQAGDFGKGFVWSSIEDLVPVTEVGDIN